MIRSFSRPVTNSSPSCRKPRSPVRRNGPRPLSFKIRAERVGRFFGAAPVALGHAGAGHPDFADAAIGAARSSFPDRRSRLLDRAALRRSRPACACLLRPAAHRSLDCFPAPWHRTCERPAARFSIRRRRSAWLRPSRSRDKTPPAEAAGRERLGEIVDRFRANRLGAVERQRPGAQVECLASLRA